jgi:CheY-like chemotaxis protein
METDVPRPVLAILNSSEDLLELLGEVFKDEGFWVVTHHLLPFRRGQEDVTQFFAQRRPDVAIWELSIPYEENWAFFHRMRQAPAVRDCPIILTTTNIARLRQAADPAIDAFEVVGKPFDLDQLICLVRQALPSHPGD